MTLFLFSIGPLLCWDNTLKSCSLRRKSALARFEYLRRPNPPTLQNAYIIYSPFGALIYIVQLGTCNRCESHRKGKRKKKSHVHACRGSLHSTVLFLEDITKCSAIGMCSLPVHKATSQTPSSSLSEAIDIVFILFFLQYN